MYEVITNNNGNVLVGNYSCVLTPLDANTVQATLPSSFNANQLLTTGTYTAIYTYYPTSNFTQPDPLTLQFQIMVRQCPTLWTGGKYSAAEPLLVRESGPELVCPVLAKHLCCAAQSE